MLCCAVRTTTSGERGRLPRRKRWRLPRGQLCTRSVHFNTYWRNTREGCNGRFQKTPRTEGVDKVPAVSGLPFGARNPGICSISRSGKIFPAIFPGLSQSFPREPPNRPRKQPQPSRVFNILKTTPHAKGKGFLRHTTSHFMAYLGPSFRHVPPPMLQKLVLCVPFLHGW